MNSFEKAEFKKRLTSNSNQVQWLTRISGGIGQHIKDLEEKIKFLFITAVLVSITASLLVTLLLLDLLGLI